jgi:hypothetical protein
MKKVKEQTTKTTINLNEIVVTDLNGEVTIVNNIVKTLANDIYKSSRTIELHDIAKALHKGESVEVEQSELQDIIMVLKGLDYILWIKVQIIKYFIDKVL